MDVLGCSLQEICEVMDFSLPAVKAALHRGRTRLRELADEPEDAAAAEIVRRRSRAAFGAYVAHFNARDFDAIRAMIADDVRLDLVNKTRLNGKAEVSPDISEIIRQAQRLASGRRVWSRAAPPSWCSIPTRRARARNISCCCSGRRTRSRPSATSATRPTSSKAPNIASERPQAAAGCDNPNRQSAL